MSNSNGTSGAARTAMAPIEQILRRRSVLLTGATGFLGKVFLSLLLRWHPEVERVYLLIRGDRRLALNRMRREILDSPVFGPLREQLGDRFDRYIEEKVAVLCGDITEEDLKMGYEANFGPRVRCRAIVLKEPRKAQEVWEKARRKPTVENFGNLAEQYSIEPLGASSSVVSSPASAGTAG